MYVVLLTGTQPARIERVMAMLAGAGHVRSGGWRRESAGAVRELTAAPETAEDAARRAPSSAWLSGEALDLPASKFRARHAMPE